MKRHEVLALNLRLKDCKFWKTPVGASKKYLVTANNEPVAGFNSGPEAAAYIKMQLSKKHKNESAHAAKLDWRTTRQS